MVNTQYVNRHTERPDTRTDRQTNITEGPETMYKDICNLPTGLIVGLIVLVETYTGEYNSTIISSCG